MFKPNRVFKKKEIHKKRPTENNIQEREQKRKMFQDTRIKQRKIEKKTTNMQKQINMKKCTTKREMNKQVFF